MFRMEEFQPNCLVAAGIYKISIHLGGFHWLLVFLNEFTLAMLRTGDIYHQPKITSRSLSSTQLMAVLMYFHSLAR